MGPRQIATAVFGMVTLWAHLPMADFPPPQGPGCGGSPRARVGSFVAHGESGGVRLLWYTVAEESTASFDISRSSSPTGPFSLVSGQIPAAGTDSSGSGYEFFDGSGSSGDYYSLSETETSGWRGSCAPVIQADESPGVFSSVGLEINPGQNPNYLGIGPPSDDALIICPDAWTDSLQTLRDHWSGFRHHNPQVATLSETGTTKEAIRSFVNSYPDLQYVLLVGDTYNREEGSNVIPTWYVQDAGIGEFATDAPYGDRDGDGLTDVALGRWPVHSSTEAAVYARKSIRYDYQDPSEAWRLQWTGFTYDFDENLVSGSLTRQLADELLALTPTQFSCVQYRASEIPCCGANREATAINAINAGAHLVWTLSTGATRYDFSHFLWNNELLGRCGPAGEWTYVPFDLSRFEANRASGFWFALSCNLGEVDRQFEIFDCARQIYIPPIAEELLRAPDKGPLTWFGPTEATYQEENYEIGRAILSRVIDETRPSVGQICMDAAKDLAYAKPIASVRAASYMFLGDPTIVMAWNTIPSSVSEISLSSVRALIVHPNPGHGALRVQFALGRSTELTLSVYDVSGRRVRVVTEGMFLAGSYGKQWDGRDDRGRAVASGIYLVRLQAADQVVTRKSVLMR